MEWDIPTRGGLEISIRRSRTTTGVLILLLDGDAHIISPDEARRVAAALLEAAQSIKENAKP